MYVNNYSFCIDYIFCCDIARLAPCCQCLYAHYIVLLRLPTSVYRLIHIAISYLCLIKRFSHKKKLIDYLSSTAVCNELATLVQQTVNHSLHKIIMCMHLFSATVIIII